MKRNGSILLAALFCLLTLMAGAAVAWEVKVINTSIANLVVKECQFNGDCNEGTIEPGPGAFNTYRTGVHCPKHLSGTFSYYYMPELTMKTVALKKRDDLPCRNSTWEICNKDGLVHDKLHLFKDGDWGFCKK